MTLPHDFQIEQPWVAPAADEKADNTDVAANIKSRLSSRGFKEMGRGWYRQHLPHRLHHCEGRRLLLDFDGIMYTGDVYLNGELVGSTDYGYVGFEADITQKVKWGQENVIAVMADTREPNNSRWYTGGGLFRGVSLVATDAQLYFNRHPLYITTRDNHYRQHVGRSVTNRAKRKPQPSTCAYASLTRQGNTVAGKRTQVSTTASSAPEERRLPDIDIANAAAMGHRQPQPLHMRGDALRCRRSAHRPVR